MSTSDRGGALDVSLGASDLLTRSAAGGLRLVLHPPWLPPPLHPAAVVERLARRGATRRSALADAVSRRLDVLVPAVLAEVLSRARLTQLVTQYLDLDEVIAAVDLDGAAKHLDLDAAVARVDLDAAVGRLDLNAVINRLDLTEIVLERVDLERVVAAVLQRIQPADLVGPVEEIIDAIDLPEIIRESTGSMASDTVRGARMHGIAADEAVARAVDRLLLRRHARDAEDGHQPPSARSSPPTWP